MKALKSLFPILLLLAAGASGQKEELSLDQILERPWELAPRGISGIGWVDDDHYAWIDGGGESARWMRTAVADGESTAMATIATVAAAAAKAGVEGLNAGHLAGATWTGSGEARIVVAGRVAWVKPDPLAVRAGPAAPADAEAVAWSPDDAHVAWSKEKDVWVAKPDGKSFRVTHGGFEHLTNGLAVHRIEFGIVDGMWWDPTGRRLAFYREDLRPIERYPIADYSSRPARDAGERYPMAGRKSSVVSIGVYDSRDDSVVWLRTSPEADEWHTNVTWSPDGEALLVAHVNREQNRMELRRWSASTGELEGPVFEEKDEQWIEPEHGPIFLPDGSGRFLWFSPRNGFNHLYMYSPDGKVEFQVTEGDFDVNEFIGFDRVGDNIFVHASGPDPRQNHLYECTIAWPKYVVQPDGGKATIHRTGERMRPITKGRGRHTALISPGSRHVLDTHSNLEHPGAVDLLTIRGEKIRTIHESENPLAGFVTGREQFFETKTSDGRALHGHLILPPVLEEGRKYPVLVYVYAGPHSQFVRDEWMGGLRSTNVWLHYMATRGMIVLRTDGRGTANRGIEWSQSVHRRLGTLEIEDQLAGLDHVLANHPGDGERVGVTGWSYGGFMTLSLMTRAGDRFAAGVSGAPVTDWRFYETGYGERYMDTPEENPEGYDTADPSSHVKGIRGRLLLVHGTSDETVVFQNSMHFLDRCIDAGMDIDYMAYPGQLHGLRGKDRQHFWRKKTAYFRRHLGVE